MISMITDIVITRIGRYLSISIKSASFQLLKLLNFKTKGLRNSLATFLF